MRVSKTVQLRELEAETGKLKELLAMGHMDVHALKSGRSEEHTSELQSQ